MLRRRVSFHTLGCKLNFSESSTLARQFAEGGFERVAPTAEADICVINSCSVTEHADKKCRNLIRRLHRRNPEAIIAVTGCYAQLKPQEIAAIDGVDIVLSNNDKGDLYRRVVELGAKGRQIVTSCTTDELTRFFAAFSGGDRTRAFLKVQDPATTAVPTARSTMPAVRAATCRSPRRWPRRAALPRPVSARSSSRRQYRRFRPDDRRAVHRSSAGARRGRGD